MTTPVEPRVPASRGVATIETSVPASPTVAPAVAASTDSRAGVRGTRADGPVARAGTSSPTPAGATTLVVCELHPDVAAAEVAPAGRAAAAARAAASTRSADRVGGFMTISATPASTVAPPTRTRAVDDEADVAARM